MPRRAWGSGSLYRRESDGRWIGRLSDGHGGHRYVTGVDKKDVQRRLRALARSTISRRAPVETVGAFLARWLDETASRTLRPRTLESYRVIVQKHIAPAVGHIDLVDLTPLDVQAMLNGIDRSPQTVAHARKVLSASLQQALRWGLVERNVARLVPAPRVTRRELHPLSAAEARAFLKATRARPQWPLYVLALTTGMRRGELLALQWRDIDLTRGTVTVTATLRQLSRYQFVREEPKTDRSRRTLPLSRLAVSALREHPATSTLFVFSRPDGRPWPPAEVTRRFQADLAASGLRHQRFHDLRHAAAALMLDRSGGDLRMVQSVLGHSTIQTTIDVYGGLAEDARRRSAAIMDKALGNMEG